jgi:hypothetical protein
MLLAVVDVGRLHPKFSACPLCMWKISLYKGKGKGKVKGKGKFHPKTGHNRPMGE